MKLVVVESPTKANTLNKYLGKDFKILASYGHVRDLPSKNGSVRPEEDFAMDYEVDSDSMRHVKAIADALKNSEAIYLATDPDREGEAISWHIVEALKEKKQLKKSFPVYRVAFNEITRSAVKKAMEEPREIDMDLVNAQQARRALDYLVGFNLSPILWRKLPGCRSAGRVQSVALRLICEREGEIEAFVSQEYWDIILHLRTEKGDKFTAKITHIEGKKLEQFDVVDEASATHIAHQLEQKHYQVSSIEKKQARRHPPAPFTTSSLQQEASRKLGFSASKTMYTAQKLYEGVDIGGETVGLITYMRTDGVTVAQEALSAVRSHIKHTYGDNYLPEKPRTYTAKAKNAQEAHEAIRPTDVARTPDEIKRYLSKEQMALYELVWKRMVASQMESAILDQVGITITSEGSYAVARATGSTVRFDGFYTLYREGEDDKKEEDEEGRRLPPMEEGEASALDKVAPGQHFTQPPPRYTEASLVKKLEELGIGRPSTYASIISVLQDRQYVRLEKHRFLAESRGRIVTAFLSAFFSRYVEYDFTAHLEEELDGIASGSVVWKEMLRHFWSDFSPTVDKVKDQETQKIISVLNDTLGHYIFGKDSEGQIDHLCPRCSNGKLGLKVGKFGAFVGCSNYPDCNYTRQLTGGVAEGETADGDKKAEALAEPKVLGVDKATGMDISLRKGPYGFYIQLGQEEGKKKPKRMSLPKGLSPEGVTMEKAIQLLALPREVGLHPDTKQPVYANIGRYGPYLQHEKLFVSLKAEQDSVLTIDLPRAVHLIAEASRKKGHTPLKVLGEHPGTGEKVAIYDGRYGPYVKHQKTNASLPKDMEPKDMTLDKALELLAAREKSGKKKVKRTRNTRKKGSK